MRRVHIDNVQLGTKLARTIFNSEGGVLLSEGIEIKDSYIEKLRGHGIYELYLEDELSEGIDLRAVICENTRNEAKMVVKNMMKNYPFYSTIEVNEIKEIVLQIIDELLLSKDIVANLSDIKSVDDYTFEHSVNVCILSVITGIGLGYDLSKLKELGTGAILHDIGKLCIPGEILKKPSQLTVEEFEIIKKHTVLGYEMLKKIKNLDLNITYIAFGHHERYDGSGYPLQLRGENIQQYSRIVAIADVYDALTSDRVYRKRIKPNEVFEYITSLGVYHFDPAIIESFVRNVSIYPIGSGVLLSTKERGIVAKANKAKPTRPIVRVLYDCNMNKYAKYYEIDLAEKTNIFILDSCEI